MWQFEPYQKDIGNKMLHILGQLGWVYLVAEERTRKSGMALWCCENSNRQDILVICPSKAIKGWQEHFDNLPLEKNYSVISMDSLHKVDKSAYDLVIVDEAHNFGSTTRTKKKGKKRATESERLVLARQICKGLPIILISATPNAQGYYMLYNQLSLSSWSPWKQYKNFYAWFKDYGIPETVYTAAGPKIKRVLTKDDEVLVDIQDGIIKYSRSQLGFSVEPVDKLHYLDAPEQFKNIYNALQTNKAIEIDGHQIVADSTMSLRTKLHQLEGATIKYRDESNTEHSLLLTKLAFKIDWLQQTFEDTDKLVIMYEYIAEQKLLKQFFKHALILQGSAYAEGVDLSDKDHLVVYSMNFRTVKYVQRRARQCGLYRTDPIVVHYPLVKGAISDQIYKTVAINKTNYTDKYYEENYI